MKYDVIIIGAGAAGLIAMKELVAKGYKVCMLEAATEAGGRIATTKEAGFSEVVEAGAEFIHSKLPLTTDLLKKAGILYVPVGGEMIPVENGEWKKENVPDEHWKEFMNHLKKQENDITIREFLVQYFSAPEYIHLHSAVQRFAEGFNLADISDASVKSVYKEWKHLEKDQYRVAGGYGKLIEYLQNCCWMPDSIIHFDSFVDTIEYKPGLVTVNTKKGDKYKGSKLIVTVSLGMLRSGEIKFDPPLIVQDTALRELGFGSVIKFLFEFNEPFWENLHKQIGFLISDQPVPTWWTQLPAETNLLTGWLGGRAADKRTNDPDEYLLKIAMDSLGSIFDMPPTSINEKLEHWKIVRWKNDPYAKGGYSYNTLKSEQAKKILSLPVYDAIWFAGEAMYAGESQGTVEAALQSGFETAEKLIAT